MVAKMSRTLDRFRYICFLLSSLWKILIGEKTGDGISFGGIMHGAKAENKLLPYYHSYRSDYHRRHGRAWLYLGHLHRSAKGREFRKILLRGWFIHFYYQVLVELLIYRIGGRTILLYQNWRIRHKIRHLKKLKIHRKYIISLTDVPESLAGAKRCMSSAKRYGEDSGMEIFPGIRKENSLAFFLEHSLTFSSTPGHEEFYDIRAEMGCFASHYLLWKKCVELDEPIMILEDDVEFCTPISPLKFREVIHLGRPCLSRNAKVMEAMSDKHQEVYNPFNFLLGAYAYGIMPLAARKLLNAAHKMVVLPTDRLIRSSTCDILFYLPHPTMTSLKHTSIRKVQTNVEEIL